MLKKIAIGSALVLGVMAASAFAQTTSTTSAAPTGKLDITAKIACLAPTVSARESAINSAFSTYTTALNAAYTARAAAFNKAYSTDTTVSSLRQDIRAAWMVFNSSARSARQAWRTARVGAWSAYRKAAKTCKAPAGATDTANSGSEIQ